MNRVVTYSLSEDFIKNLADWLENHYIRAGKDLSSLALVFGGQRPALFLKKELSGRIQKEFYPPRFFSIDEFVEEVLREKDIFSTISDLDAAFIIYTLAKTKARDILKGRASFSAFLPWAKEILSFIEQLDLEEIPVKSLKDIQLNAEIGYDVPESVNLLLSRVADIRDAFHQVLLDKKTYSRGLKYLLASRSVAAASLRPYAQILFCNFFYLHKTETSIIKNLYDRQKAFLFFQGDGDAWSVLKKVARDLEVTLKPEKDSEVSYGLFLRPAFDLHSEVCLLRQALGQVSGLEKTVIVLPEPATLIPLLSEIAASADNFNVSMGYPLMRSPVASLFEALFKAQETKKGGSYYTKDYLRLLNHPLIKNLRIVPEASVTRILTHKIEEILLGMEESALGGSLFVSLGDIETCEELYASALDTMKKMGMDVTVKDMKGVVKKLHFLSFGLWEEAGDFERFCRSLEEFLDFLSEKSFLERYPLNVKIVEKMLDLAAELKSASFASEPFSQDEIFKIFRNKLESETFHLKGSPLKGLQILGLLETRALSFENVLVLDANESVLPKLKIYEPLIPRDVMMSVGLNRLEKEEEIQRYQFLRLLGSAKNVTLFYQQTADKERSRFIEELIWEKQKKEDVLDVLAEPKASFSVEVLPREIKVPKEDKEIAFLKGFRYSASSVNTYLHCPLRFYYQYVLRLREKEALSEEPEAREVGTFIHELLEEVFARFIGSRPRIDAAFRKFFFDACDKKFEKDLRRKMKSDAFLMEEVLRYRLEKFLDNEAKRPVKELVCVEKVFEGTVGLEGGPEGLRFKSKIDRIDRLEDESLLILDYKTGGGDVMPASCAKINSQKWTRPHLKRTVRSFQLPLYFYFVRQTAQAARINAGLYQFKELDKDLGLKLFLKSEDDFRNVDEMMAVFMKALAFVCREILDSGVAFEADPQDPFYCQGCPFFYLCR
jgi:hypothetical protein